MSMKLDQKLLEDIRLQRQLLEFKEEQNKARLRNWLPGSSGLQHSNLGGEYLYKSNLERLSTETHEERTSKASSIKKKARNQRENGRSSVGELTFRKDANFDTVSLFSGTETGNNRGRGRRSLDLGEVGRYPIFDSESTGHDEGRSYIQLREISRDAQRLSDILHGWKKKQKATNRNSLRKTIDFEESLQLLARLQKATATLNAEAPRKSVDLRGFDYEIDGRPRVSFESSKSASVDLRDAIRTSLNQQKLLYSSDTEVSKSTARNSDGKKRIPNVVARLMGLEELPPPLPSEPETRPAKGSTRCQPQTSDSSSKGSTKRNDSNPGSRQKSKPKQQTVKRQIKEIKEEPPVPNCLAVSLDHKASKTVKEILEAIHVKGMLHSFSPKTIEDLDHRSSPAISVSEKPSKGNNSHNHRDSDNSVPQKIQTKGLDLHNKTTAASRCKKESAVKVPVDKKNTSEEGFRKSVSNRTEIRVHEGNLSQRTVPPPPPPPPPPPLLHNPRLQDYKRNSARASKPVPRKSVSPERPKTGHDHLLSRKARKSNAEQKPQLSKDINRKPLESKLGEKIASKLSRLWDPPSVNDAAQERKQDPSPVTSTSQDVKLDEPQEAEVPEASPQSEHREHGSGEGPDMELSSDDCRASCPEVSVERYVISEQTDSQEQVKYQLDDSETRPAAADVESKLSEGRPDSDECRHQVCQKPHEETAEETETPSETLSHTQYIWKVLRCNSRSEKERMDSNELYSRLYFKIEKEESNLSTEIKVKQRELFLDRQVLLDCVKELLRKKMRLQIEDKQSLGLVSYLPTGANRCRTIDEAARELCSDVDAMLDYHSDSAIDSRSENDWLYAMLKRDLYSNRSDVHSIWSSSWEHGMYGPDEVHDLCRDIEKLVFEQLLEELLFELQVHVHRRHVSGPW